MLIKIFPRILRNPEGSLPPLVRIMSKTNPVHVMSFYFFKIHFNIILLPSLRSPKWLDTGQNLKVDFYVAPCHYATARSQVAVVGGGHRVWAPSAKYRMNSSGQATRGSLQSRRIRRGDKYLALEVPTPSEMSRWDPDMDGLFK
jgi:hypothetical protein